MSRRAVEFPHLSPARVPSENAVGKPESPIFPILHTAYDYDERF
jgi:hypothetical protein